MGTAWSAKVAAPPGLATGLLRAGIQSQLDRVVQQMSTWEPASDLSRFNTAPAGTWHTLPPELFHVLDTALNLARGSAGAYDPTAGALVNLWGFGPAGPVETPPDAQTIAAVQARGGWQKLRLDRVNQRACQPGGLYIDLSSIAKGYGVDQAARYLEGAGLHHWLLEVGGELRGAGAKPDGQPWWVTLESPQAAPATSSPLPENLLALHGLAVATSGDYHQGFTHAGRRYSHTLDPRTGQPVAHELAAVTVIHPECMLADAYATVLMVLGVKEGMVYARSSQLAARFVSRTARGFEETLTPAFAALASD